MTPAVRTCFERFPEGVKKLVWEQRGIEFISDVKKSILATRDKVSARL
jgi:hypothetical protein